jgi:hypothetical protein
MVCKIDGCEREIKIRGYCANHYRWARRHGLIERARAWPRPVSVEGKVRSLYKTNADGCWLWQGTIDVHGYGVIVDERLRNAKAHRRSYEAHVGPVPPELHVLHRCDVRACINPAHLFLGTDADNMKDCIQKGRNAYGERNGYHKLTRLEVDAIRSEFASGQATQSQLAAKYNVDPSWISRIISGECWVK